MLPGFARDESCMSRSFRKFRGSWTNSLKKCGIRPLRGVLSGSSPARPTWGKSTALRLVAERLRAAGLLPVLVDPPRRSLDAGPVALVQAAVGLSNGGDGMLQLLTKEASWVEKLSLVLERVEREAERVVILCDEPFHGASHKRGDAYSWHAEEAFRSLLAVACRRIVAGMLPRGATALVRGHRHHLERRSDPLPWLEDAEAWGVLAPEAAGLALAIESGPKDRSPLEVRLLVAVAAVRSVEDAVRLQKGGLDRRGIAEELAKSLGGFEPRRAFLRRAWQRLCVVRRPVANDFLGRLVGDPPDERAGAVLWTCLLDSQDGASMIHWTLRRDAAEFLDPLPPEELQAVHRALARFYADRFEQQGGQAFALLDEMEAFYHATQAADQDLMSRLRAYFSDQLDLWGRTLSQEFRMYREAASVFERALSWDPDDDYAHHYLAFNLDILADLDRLQDIEEHYQRAIELREDHLWWHSRWVSYLITRGRIREARLAWNEALDALELPDPDAEDWVYENLHLWVARLLVHRGRLEFAEEVLRGIPRRVLEQSPGLAAVARRHRALLEARRGRVVFPLSVPPERWWSGPHVCPRRRDVGPLVRWLPGRIDTISGGTVRILAAEPPLGGVGEAVYGFLTIAAEDFDRWSQDELLDELAAGRFVELAWYGEDPNPIIRVHPGGPWEDPDLPPLFPDPARYLRAAGWVEKE